MKTINISDEAAEFISALVNRLRTQDNRGTADPYYFTVCKLVDVPVPEGCGDKTIYFDSDDCESYTEEQAKERADELEMTFDDYIDYRCHKYDCKEQEKYENFFLTLEGYNEHVKLNGHNIARECNKFYSYVDHAYRNPEIENLLKYVKEIGDAIQSDKT